MEVVGLAILGSSSRIQEMEYIHIKENIMIGLETIGTD